MRRILLLLVLVLLAWGLAWSVRDLGWASLARNQAALLDWVAAHPARAAACYVGAYIATAALSLPHAALLTVAGGMLFGAVTGTVLTAIGATVGACVLMFVLRALFKDQLDREQHRIPPGMRERLKRDGASYLLAIRCLPVFPFVLVNLACVVLGVRLAVFVPTTLFGVVPVSYILSLIGEDIAHVVAAGRTPDLAILFAPRVLTPLFGLAVLCLVPVLLRRRQAAHA